MKVLFLVAGLACALPAWAATEWVRGEVDMLAPWKVGDKVRFQVLEHDSKLIVQQIQAQR